MPTSPRYALSTSCFHNIITAVIRIAQPTISAASFISQLQQSPQYQQLVVLALQLRCVAGPIDILATDFLPFEIESKQTHTHDTVKLHLRVQAEALPMLQYVGATVGAACHFSARSN